MSYTYEYPRPAVTVDTVIFFKRNSCIEVLLIQRKNEPFKDCWATPGGFIDLNEDPLLAAMRELEEETALRGIDLEPIGFSGTPKRDPRGHTVSLWYVGFATEKQMSTVVAQDDAKAVKWFNVDNLPDLAFDHNDLLVLAKKGLL